MTSRVDNLDLEILKALSENARKTMAQIAKEVGISRPTAMARLKTLNDKQIVDFNTRVNVRKLGLKLALITFENDNAETQQQLPDLITRLKACPRILQLVQGIDKPTYTALICAENAETLLSSIECIRSVLNAKIVTWQRIKPIIGETFDLKLFLEKCELTPCGKKCGLCSDYQESECIGCPATTEYKGSF
jgi:Lrp/AsnC family leucine-responsive transcriptional regulator